MIVRIVKLSIHPEKLDQFYEYYNSVKAAIRSSPGCSHTELLSNISGDGILFTYSTWDKPEDLENYRKSELFLSTWALVKPLFRAKAEAWSLIKKDPE